MGASEVSRFEIASSLTFLAMTEKGVSRNDKAGFFRDG